MNEKKCCVLYCNKNRADDLTLHIFPNPEKDLDRFNKWIYAIGGNVLVIEPHKVFKHGRVCHNHFEAKYYTSSRRLSRNAVPSLNIKGLKTAWRNVLNDYQQTSKEEKVQALPKPLFAQLLNDKGFQSDQVKNGEVEDIGIIEKECDNESQEIAREVIVIEALVHQPPPQHAKTPAGEVSKTFKNQAEAKDMTQEIEMVNEEITDISSEVILMDEEIIEEYVVDKASGELLLSTTEKCAGKGDVEVPKIKEGAYCIFTEEGSLFPGRIQKVNPLQVCVLQKPF